MYNTVTIVEQCEVYNLLQSIVYIVEGCNVYNEQLSVEWSSAEYSQTVYKNQSVYNLQYSVQF